MLSSRATAAGLLLESGLICVLYGHDALNYHIKCTILNLLIYSLIMQYLHVNRYDCENIFQNNTIGRQLKIAITTKLIYKLLLYNLRSRMSRKVLHRLFVCMGQYKTPVLPNQDRIPPRHWMPEKT